jgi:two-component system KDP operon response regulator KdpE
MKVVLIEDNQEIIEAVVAVFQLRWPEVSMITTMYGEKGIELTKIESPDLIILDLGLPDIDGFQVLRRVREFSNLPVIILTAQGDEINKIRGLELGADDYIVKPFLPGELLARVRALLRRFEQTVPKDAPVKNKNLTIVGALRIDTASKEVTVGEKHIKLSPRAYDLLYQLVMKKGEFVPVETLMKAVVDPGENLGTDIVTYLIKTLNEEIGDEIGTKDLIVSEPGKGYKLSLH